MVLFEVKLRFLRIYIKHLVFFFISYRYSSSALRIGGRWFVNAQRSSIRKQAAAARPSTNGAWTLLGRSVR